MRRRRVGMAENFAHENLRANNAKAMLIWRKNQTRLTRYKYVEKRPEEFQGMRIRREMAG
jgi:hypothetical protein